MKDIGVIGSSDGPTAIFVSSKDENFWQSGGIIEENDEVNVLENDMVENSEVATGAQEEKNLTSEELQVLLDSKTMGENFEAGIKIMGLGMVAVFGVLTILYIVIKVMGQFAKGNKDKDNE